MEMQKLANIYQTKHRNGYVSKVTDYSFTFVENQKAKDVKPKSYVVMKSYFYNEY